MTLLPRKIRLNRWQCEMRSRDEPEHAKLSQDGPVFALDAGKTASPGNGMIDRSMSFLN